VEAYIDEFKDLINLSGYTDPIAIMLKFHRGLNPMTQDRIARSGTDRLSDMDFKGWFTALCSTEVISEKNSFLSSNARFFISPYNIYLLALKISGFTSHRLPEDNSTR
jgi:hypothetical protein